MDLLLRRKMMEAGSSPTPPTPTPEFYSYLYFDGTAYIDIDDITPGASSSYRVALGNETTKGAQRLFYVKTANSASTCAFLSASTNTTNRAFSIYYGSSSAASTNRRLAWTYATYVFFLTPKRFGFGNTAYTITTGSNAPSGGLVLGSSTTHSGNPFTGFMGIFRIYGSDAQNATNADDLLNNYTPVTTLRPCLYNGQAGMWHVEGNKFYGNTAGAGTLTVSNTY